MSDFNETYSYNSIAKNSSITTINIQLKSIYGFISGKITSSDNVTALPDAIIYVYNIGTTNMAADPVTTATNGTYQAAVFPAGNYDVVVYKDGYMTKKQTGISETGARSVPA